MECDRCCWEWQGARHPKGYGKLSLTDAEGKKVWIPTHVMAWELHHECFLSLDLWGLHRCDNPPCCNYYHIFAGTHQDNMDDMCRKGRQVRGDRHWTRRSPERRARGDRHGSHTRPERIRRGEGHHATTLTPAQVIEMRALAATERYACAELARLYRLSPEGVRRVIVGETWGHLPGAVRPTWPRWRSPQEDRTWCKGRARR
jgi:hypothetical protein